MHPRAKQFKQQSEVNASDFDRKNILRKAFGNYHAKREKGIEQFSDLELARRRAAAIKQRTIENLEKYLIEFESNFIKNGGKLIWAQDKNEALQRIEEIILKENAQFVIKGKSMVAEEIELNELLEKKLNVKAVETDLGEFIQQLAGEPPYHIVTPCVHKTTEEISELFRNKLNVSPGSAEQLTFAARSHLRTYLRNSTVGITGANFLVADTGSVAITENEGNAFFSVSSSSAHIVIAGVEKLIPSVNDLELFWPLLASHGTGQTVTTYNHLISGPDETKGPGKFYLVLIDNGRSAVLEKTEQRSVLACIRCGACYNVCPVYRNIGGHAYGHAYGGPLGKVLSPLLANDHSYDHLSFASTLCGACTDICPVKIDLHKQILNNRRDFQTGKTEKIIWKAWKKAMLNRKLMDKGGALAKNTMLSLFFSKLWGKERDLPKAAPKSFNQLMRDRLKGNSN